ncbi:MAG: hypothetical protein ACFB22_10610 [Rhodothalassiaceae bacterium]
MRLTNFVAAFAFLAGAGAAAIAVDDVAEDVAKGEEEAQLFYEMTPLNVGVVVAGRSRGNILFNIILEASDAKVRARLKSEEPKLRAAFITHLGDYFRLRYEPDRALDLTYMTAVLQQAADEVMGGPKATVLIQEARLSR